VVAADRYHANKNWKYSNNFKNNEVRGNIERNKMKVFRELQATATKFADIDNEKPEGYAEKLKSGQAKHKNKEITFFPQFTDKVWSYQTQKMVKRERPKSTTLDSIERFYRGTGGEWQYQKFESGDGLSRNDALNL